tara:strand:- start:689 stop:1123 length:435 start_codon:yes stop_codon:yes gene_type:complete
MNLLLLIIIGLPIFEIYIMINLGQQIGALNTILLIFSTAIIGVFYARLEGLNTIKSGLVNIYQNKTPLYEIISGASIAVAAFLLILPGFFTDTIGFLLLIPFTRKILISLWIKDKLRKKTQNTNEEIIDAEIIEEKKPKKEDEL